MRFILALAGICLYSASLAQDVSGVVYSEAASHSDPTVMFGASIVWNTLSDGTTSDSDGKWKLAVDPDATALLISFTGYSTDTVPYTGQAFIETVLQVGEQLGTAQVEVESSTTEMSMLDPTLFQTLNEKELCKAACCNLSEAFETNASIDASFTDAVTGTRQIQMLGLSGRYVQMMQDNVPSIRGLSSIYGLSHIPGPWISSIQIAKGVGSVTSGHESITGQINTTLKNPNNSEDDFYLNLFFNAAARSELNAIANVSISERWSTSVMLHGMYSSKRFDKNSDGFVDNPLKEQIVVRNSWHYNSKRVFGEYAFTAIDINQQSGQMDFRPGQESSASAYWGAESQSSRYFLTAKTGLAFPGQDWKSIGSQFSYNHHDQSNQFGVNSYKGLQQTFRANVLFASRFDDAQEHTFTTGMQVRDDRYSERLGNLEWQRNETVAGTFLEYNWTQLERFTLVGGLRADYNFLFDKVFVLPRLHARWSLTEKISLKAVAGKGVRTAAVVMENLGLLASNRNWRPSGAFTQNSLVFQPEEAWNMGVSYNQKFRLNYRDASISVDGYLTQFQNQVVVDVDQDAQEVNVYNLQGESWSQSVQAEFAWSPAKRLDVRLAYRWLDVQTDMLDSTGATVRRNRPMISKHRAFANIAYETRENDKGGQWRADATVQWIGQARLPDTSANPEDYQLAEFSDDYVMLNAQITWAYSSLLEFYLGSENILNFKQDAPILSADDPFGEHFDASMVWGPVFGRNAFVGLRWRIQ